MSFEMRLQKLESQVLKSNNYKMGMAIMEQLVIAEKTDNRESIPGLLLKLFYLA